VALELEIKWTKEIDHWSGSTEYPKIAAKELIEQNLVEAEKLSQEGNLLRLEVEPTEIQMNGETAVSR